jgi:hypothetical protein
MRRRYDGGQRSGVCERHDRATDTFRHSFGNSVFVKHGNLHCDIVGNGNFDRDSVIYD